MWSLGAYSTNDILDKENENPVPGGDERFVPLNMIPARLAVARAEADAATGAAKEEPAPPPGTSAPAGDELRSLTPGAAAAAIIAAHRPALVDAAARCARREAEVVRRKAKNPGDGLPAAVDAFYDGHGDYVRTALRPALDALAGSLRAVGADVANVDAERWVGGYLTESRAAIAAAVADGRLDDALAEWEHARAAALTDRITHDLTTRTQP
jgi:hypothetical protein